MWNRPPAAFWPASAAACLTSEGTPPLPPPETALGALMAHITNADARHFQPMNVNYGLFPELPGRVKKKEKRQKLAERALAALDEWLEQPCLIRQR